MGTNNVEVNEERIREELTAAGGGAPLLEGEHIPAPGAEAAPGGAPGADQEQPGDQGGMDWTLASRGLVLIFDKVVCPNWHLTGDEKDMLAGATQEVLRVWFPNVRIDPRIQSLLVLGGALVSVAAARMDPETGKLRPMRERAPAPEPEPEPGQDAGGDANRTAA